MTLPHYNATGRKQTAYKVSADVFDLPRTNHNLLKLAYEHYLSQRRTNSAQVKNRSSVRGGGRKPWPQKGRGRARVSSIRSPLWRGGGVIFGPTGDENYSKKLNKKAKVLALRQALTLKNERIVTLKSLPEDGKTAILAKLLFETLKLDRKILLVGLGLPEPARLAARNLQDVDLIQVDYLNVFRVLNADWLVFTSAALESLQDRISSLNVKIMK